MKEKKKKICSKVNDSLIKKKGRTETCLSQQSLSMMKERKKKKRTIKKETPLFFILFFFFEAFE